MVNSKGEYVTEEVSATEAEVKLANVEPVKAGKKVTRTRPEMQSPVKEEDLAKVVDKLPVYPGGNEGFQEFLNQQSRDGVKRLEEGQTKAFVMVEYIIDQQGKPVYAKVIRGGNDGMNEKIEDAFMNMPQWSPAVRTGKNVAIKLKQTIMIGTD